MSQLNSEPIDPETIDHIAIYPSIGIARLGNSEEKGENNGWFYASEIPGKFDTPLGGYKDANGRIKRQAARFRVYAFDSRNKVLGELNNKSGYTIEWTVNIANKKAASYVFQDRYLHARQPTTKLRNPKVQPGLKPDERSDLIIDSGPKPISGVSREFTKLTGIFKVIANEPKEIYLGEISTDEEGRLIVLAGKGESKYVGKGAPTVNGFDNAEWYDDISDGSIHAVAITGSGKRIVTEKDSWVLGVPPKYGSAIGSPVSLYDQIEDVNYRQLHGEKDGYITEVQYYRDIEPILRRPALLSWVNSTANQGHGVNRPGYFLDPIWQKYLSNPQLESEEETEKAKVYRQSIFSRLRFPEIEENKLVRQGQASKYFMPRLYGDAETIGDGIPGDPESFSALTNVQYMRMKKWADGDFDTKPYNQGYTKIEDFPIEDQPENLTRAALEWGVGSPLHPGIEVSYNAMNPDIYDDPEGYNGAFRFKSSVKPGDLTMTMSLPWQSDTYNCYSLWWPSARPGSIVEEKEYERVKTLYKPEEVAAHLNRVGWARDINSPMEMINHWADVGFIVPVSETKDTIFVETQRNTIIPPPIKPDIDPLKPSITTIEDLRDHLKLAMRLELSTIPLYLFAMYSINDDERFDTPDHIISKSGRDVKYILRSIASEEMLHLSLAGNLLLAIGGTPLLYDKTIIPTYPSTLINRLPVLELNLRPATKESLQTFMEIEKPEKDISPPEGDMYETIGQFYKAIKDGFDYLNLKPDSNLFANPRTGFQFNSMHGEYAPKDPGAGSQIVVHDITSAQKAIKIIVDEGEGADGEFDSDDKKERCHYTRFQRLKDGSHKWNVYSLLPNPTTEQYQYYGNIANLSNVFNMAYCYLLKAIETLWKTDDPKLRQNILYGAMYATMIEVMGPLAEFMCQQPVEKHGKSYCAGPCFEYYKFEKDAVDEMKYQMDKTISSYGSNPPSALEAIQNSIANLFDIDKSVPTQI